MIFYEGDEVTWSGSQNFVAEGHIIALGSNSAHVKWLTGPDAGRIVLTSLFDIEPAREKVEDDPLHFTAVRRAYDRGQETEVLNFLASNGYLDNWAKIAQDVVAHTEALIRADASMDLVDDQLSTQERTSFVRAAALTLLRDSFGIIEE